jgi:transcriptional regulator with XRE-family HTH domain
MSDAPAGHHLIAGRLKEGRECLGLTQADVAGALGIPRSSISAIESGTRKVSGLELRRLSRLYRRTVGWLLGEETVPDPAILAAVQGLAETDRAQVLRFAEFLASAGKPPRVTAAIANSTEGESDE